MPEKLSAASILMKFFGRKPNQSLQDFSAELKELTPEDKQELVELAAAEMGVEIKE